MRAGLAGGAERSEWRLAEAPDGRFLAVWQDDLGGVHRVPIVELDGALERVTWVPNAKTGTPLPRATLHIVEPATGRLRPDAAV